MEGISLIRPRCLHEAAPICAAVGFYFWTTLPLDKKNQYCNNDSQPFSHSRSQQLERDPHHTVFPVFLNLLYKSRTTFQKSLPEVQVLAANAHQPDLAANKPKTHHGCQ